MKKFGVANFEIKCAKHTQAPPRIVPMIGINIYKINNYYLLLILNLYN